MTNSLQLAGLEMVGTTTNPEYRLATGLDTGQLLPVTASLSSLILDGAVITGETTGNRVWNLTVLVFSLDGTRLTLSRNVDTLLSAVNADTFPVVWTPTGCPSTNYTAYRSTATPQKTLLLNDVLFAQVALSFETGPFGVSSAPQSTTVSAVGGPGQLQIDGMNSGTFTGGAVLSTATKFEGAGSMQYTLPAATNGVTSVNGGRTFPGGPFDLSSKSLVAMRIMPASSHVADGEFFLGLTDSHGVLNLIPSSGYVLSVGTWRLVTFDLAYLRSGFDQTSVASWGIGGNINVSAGYTAGTFMYFDDFRAYPPGSVGNSTAEGTVLNVPAFAGSARTPVAVAVARSAAAQTSGNILTAADSSMESSIGGWAPAVNCTVASSTAQALQGTHSLAITAVAAGSVEAFAGVGSKAVVTPNTVYTLTGASRAAATPRPFLYFVRWSDRSENIIGSDITPTVNDTTTGWTTTSATLTSPPNAAFADVVVQYNAAATGEVHYADAVGIVVGAAAPWVIGTGIYQGAFAFTVANLLLHSPPTSQDPDATILAGLSAGTVTIPDANMNYDDTFSVVAFLSGSATASRTITATLTQKVGATTVATATLNAAVSGTQTILSLGGIALPLVAVPTDNSNGSLIIAITSSNGTDAFTDVALCSTSGQTILLPTLPAGTTAVYVDQPDPTVGVGPLYCSATDRTSAFSCANLANPLGGPLIFEPGNNQLLVASTSGAPNASLTVPSAWLDEALV